MMEKEEEEKVTELERGESDRWRRRRQKKAGEVGGKGEGRA